FEIGWWLWPHAWGRGLASEAALRICEEAFGQVGAPSLVARIQAANAASLGVAAKLGMSHEGESTGRTGEPLSVYRLLRPGTAVSTRDARTA
ncbi:MAG: GNAT family N-acetyltransferase, partial [Solirubrobacteraceae bacterium]